MVSRPSYACFCIPYAFFCFGHNGFSPKLCIFVHTLCICCVGHNGFSPKLCILWIPYAVFVLGTMVSRPSYTFLFCDVMGSQRNAAGTRDAQATRRHYCQQRHHPCYAGHICLSPMLYILLFPPRTGGTSSSPAGRSKAGVAGCRVSQCCSIEQYQIPKIAIRYELRSRQTPMHMCVF